MNFHRITPLVFAALAMLMAHVLAAGGVAQAQNFPSKQINVIVGTGPGDPGDMIARLIQSRMVERFGQSWVVDNRPAASGKIGSQVVARSAPDGHTLLVVLSAHAVNPAGAIELPYDTARDFAGISLIARQPMIIAVHPTVKGSNLKEFIEAARANPSGKLTNLKGSLTFSDWPWLEQNSTLKNVSLQIYGDNLANTRYRLGFVDFGTYGSASFNRPRTYGARLRTEF